MISFLTEAGWITILFSLDDSIPLEAKFRTRFINEGALRILTQIISEDESPSIVSLCLKSIGNLGFEGIWILVFIFFKNFEKKASNREKISSECGFDFFYNIWSNTKADETVRKQAKRVLNILGFNGLEIEMRQTSIQLNWFKIGIQKLHSH